MTACKPNTSCHPQKEVQSFIERVKSGINYALKQNGPVLIVAHGGVYLAICHLMDINSERAIDNCIPIHFTVYKNGKWSAKKIV